MAALLKKLLIGTSVAVGISAIATLPAKAAAFDFDNNKTNYATYTHQDGNLWIKGNETAAISALTDGNLQTNVELNYTNETNSSSVGFTVTAGNYTAKVSSVTNDEFNAFQGEWLNGLLSTYQPLQTVWNNLTAPFQAIALEVFKSTVGFGDPNIAEFSLDQTGAMSMKTMGFYDIKPRASLMVDAAINQLPQSMKLFFTPQANSFKAALQQINGPLQISEIVKVELNGNAQYVYGFNAQASNFTAKDDKQSYSGVFSWSQAGVPVGVPEPSTILGLMAVGGLFGAAQRKNHS